MVTPFLDNRGLLSIGVHAVLLFYLLILAGILLQKKLWEGLVTRVVRHKTGVPIAVLLSYLCLGIYSTMNC